MKKLLILLCLLPSLAHAEQGISMTYVESLRASVFYQHPSFKINKETFHIGLQAGTEYHSVYGGWSKGKAFANLGRGINEPVTYLELGRKATKDIRISVLLEYQPISTFYTTTEYTVEPCLNSYQATKWKPRPKPCTPTITPHTETHEVSDHELNVGVGVSFWF